MLKRLLILVCLLPGIINAQHPYYASLNQQLLSTNPAFAGSNKQLRVQAIGGTLNEPKYGYYKDAYFFSADMLIKKHSGLAISAHQELNGKAYSNTQADISYAYHINMGEKWKIVPALQVSVFQVRLDRSYLSFSDLQNVRGPFVPQFDNTIQISTKTNFDISSGLMVYQKNFFVGASLLSFTQPDEGLLGVSKRPLTQVYQISNRFQIGEQSSIDAYTFFKAQKYRETFLQYGAYANLKFVSVHLANRINDVSNYNAVIMGLAFNASGFKIGYNTQLNYSKNQSNYFFNEVYLSMNFGKRKKSEEASSAQDQVKLFY